jgi:DNA-directed RNA polymerase specialized sigma24 family protein
VALVARSKRELLLRVHRHRLRHEDLEDCLSQATMELVAQVKRGVRFASAAHVSNALEVRLLSRIYDRRRALAGRSPMQAALESAAQLEGPEGEQLELIDLRAELETLVILRQQLRQVRDRSGELTDDQRLVLSAQVADLDAREFCQRHGWTAEKYRKVAQRGRARLRALTAPEEVAVPHSSSSS